MMVGMLLTKATLLLLLINFIVKFLVYLINVFSSSALSLSRKVLITAIDALGHF